jgi:hypothetical protein
LEQSLTNPPFATMTTTSSIPYDDASLPIRTSSISQPVRLRLNVGSHPHANISPVTILSQFDTIVAQHGEKPALHHQRKTAEHPTVCVEKRWLL